MRKNVRDVFCGLALAVSVAVAVPALAEDYDIPVVTGEHWQKSTPQERKAFLVGAATIIELDQEVQGATPAKNSTIDAWAKGLSHFNFEQMATAIDQWYAAHPDKISRPLIEVMWYELVEPKLPPGAIGKASATGGLPATGKAKP